MVIELGGCKEPGILTSLLILKRLLFPQQYLSQEVKVTRWEAPEVGRWQAQ